MSVNGGPAGLTSIVLPVHDQEDHIERIVRSYLAAIEVLPRRHELVLVTNGCHDRSPAICAALAEQEAAVRHLDLAASGWGRAVRAGLAASHGDLLCYTNAARTTPEILVVMLAYALAY